ncbi:DUF4837 family protein [Flavobacterium aquicola]|uniref:Uncharacterized protein DUF4837 n=1 Tax=Flavobacterium aquicola TaxID=1682742 RepID=A0A3E0E1Q2_9FLAO|nr:DUF4837 family protein [Flavobacterium aquicola]REG92222.1 uncharacterized protein DUF4837 [Flavobacterium aquicola]
MYKSLFLYLSFLSILFFSCKKQDDDGLPRNSTGKINTISVVIDDQLWNGIIGDSIRNKFASPVEGLSKEEPQFDINQYPINVMEGFVTKSRTIIVVKQGTDNNFKIKKDEYAAPQNVIHITGKTLSDLSNIIEKRAPQIIKIIKEGEIKAHQLLLNDSLVDPETIEKQCHLSLKIPKKYSYSLKNKSFVWLKQEFPSGSTSLLLTQLPLNTISSEDNVLEKVIKVHDSIGALYIRGKEPKSSLYIDKSYPLYLSQITLDGKPAYETKGTWRLKDSFMFGAFINYMIIDAKNNRIVYLEGFCYVPSRERRNYMHELESIIKGVKIN